mmetsp:Transcript_659/g.1372  ORF Transcript_659/g.1372 Transcript_659/m.1372 type:complete len:204 (+) Transcript_659:77-688(+)
MRWAQRSLLTVAAAMLLRSSMTFSGVQPGLQRCTARADDSGTAEKGYRIRKARDDDMPWIALTVTSMIMSPFGLSAPNFRVAEDTSGERLGFAQLRSLTSEDSGPFLLASLFVTPAARGQGIATQLVSQLLENKQRQRPSARCPVYALTLKNKLRFFERLNFRELEGDETKELPQSLALEVRLGRFIAPLAAGEPLIVLRNDG